MGLIVKFPQAVKLVVVPADQARIIVQTHGNNSLEESGDAVPTGS